MARPKARWQGRILKNMFRDGGSVVLLGRLEHDPDRITEFRINRSNVAAFTVATVKEAELSESDIKSLLDSLTKIIAPEMESNGKHHVDEF